MSNEQRAGVARALEVGGVTPILRVASLDASLAYYVDALGFAIQWRDRGFACVRRGEAAIMLSEGDQGHPGTWVYVGVSDADAFHEEVRVRGAIVRHPPTNYPWGSREVHIADPDGNVLRLGSDVVAGEPMGDWLDGEGRRWLLQPDGGWRAAD